MSRAAAGSIERRGPRIEQLAEREQPANGHDRHRQQQEVERDDRSADETGSCGGQHERDREPGSHRRIFDGASAAPAALGSSRRDSLAPCRSRFPWRASCSCSPRPRPTSTGRTTRRTSGSSSYGARQRRARLPRRRGCAPPERRAPLPRLPRVHHERGLPRAPRARDTRCPAREAECGLRRRDSGGPRDRERLRGRLGARPLARGLGRRDAAAVASPRRRLRAARRLGGLLPRRAASARSRAHTGGGRRPALRPGRGRAAALRIRGRALRRALPKAALGDAARGRRRLHAARRGDARDRARAQLARVVVGVARADGNRVRHRRRRRSDRVPAPPIRGRRLQGPLPRAHRRARRPPLRTGARPSRRRRGAGRRVQRGRGAAARAGRTRSSSGSTSSSARTSLLSFSHGSAKSRRPRSWAASSAT